MRRLKCAEIWGGIKNTDLDVCSSGVTVSLYSSACDGGRGGDVYYFSVCGADRVTRLVLADVVGHGEQVAEVSQWVFEQMAARLDDPDLPGMVSHLNRQVVARGFGAMTTAIVISYYVDLKHLYYCSAGHPPILRAADDAWTALPPPAGPGESNLPLGVLEATRYDMPDAALASGDRLLLYTDGVVEARNADGELFGERRLKAALDDLTGADPMHIKTQILNRLRDWSANGLAHDDVTLIAIQLS